MAVKVGDHVVYSLTPAQAAAVFNAKVRAVNADGTFAIALDDGPSYGNVQQDTNNPPAPGKFVLSPPV